MPKDLTLNLNGAPVTVSIERIERSDLYGNIVSQILDDGEPCTRVRVLMDGTILGPKSTKTALLIDGLWIEDEDTRRFTPEGRELVKHESSFKSELTSEFSHYSELLDYCIKAVYSSSRVCGNMKFSFTYNAGYPKTAFMIEGADGNGYMLIGEPAPVSWVGHKDCLTGETEEWTEEDMEEMFG
jgi:hypothetical protein